MTIRVGVIGVGVMGSDHARTLQHVVSGATVSAVTDFAADRAAALAEELGARAFGSADELIGADVVDAVIIASPDHHHAAQVMSCLYKRKPLLCEKPLAPSLDDCRAVVDAQNDLALPHPLVSVGFMRRFDPGYVELAAAVAADAVGEALMVRCSHRNVASYPGGDSATTITNTAIHEIDVARWLLGSDIVEVSWHAGRSTPNDPSRQDPQLLLLRNENGVLMVLDIFVNARYGYDVRCVVLGADGAISLAPTPLTWTDRALHSGTCYPEDWRPRFAEAYRFQSQGWIDSLAANRPSPLATAEDGLAATAVAASLIESMNNDGVPVAVKR
jgi:myo-inositol 2-dehydrogenase / D-chiro-inositol 1-dehydrogenase